jgi:hypothetical protein
MAGINKYALVAVGVAGGVYSSVDPNSVRLSPELQRELYRDGGVRHKQAVVFGADPVTEFSTADIKLVSALSALDVDNPLTLYFAELDEAGGHSGTYVSIACQTGLVEPVSITAQTRGRAMLAVRVHHLSSDGDAVPFTVGSTAPADEVMDPGYVLGPAIVGTALNGCQSVTLNWGYNVKTDRGENGKPFGKIAYAPTQDATLQISIHDLAEATANRLHHGSIETTVSVQFRKLSNAAALPVDSGGYLVTVAKAHVDVNVSGAEEEGTVELNASLLETGGSYLTFGDVA